MRPLILAVIATCLLGWPQMAQEQRSKAHTPNGNSKADAKPVPPVHVIIEQPVPTITTQVKAEDQKEKPKDEPWKRFFTPEWIIVYVTAGYALIAWWTLSAIKRQAKTMEQQRIDSNKSGAETINALNRQITAMESHVEATQNNAKAATLAAQAVINSERPWLIAEVVERKPNLLHIPEVGDPIHIQGKNVFGVRIKNVGRTPARITRSALEYVKLDSLSQLPDNPVFVEITDEHHGMMLFPEGEPFGRIAFLRPRTFLSKAEVSAIAVRDAFIYAYGLVEYRCIFGCAVCPHLTRFGYVYNFPQGGEPPVLLGFMPGGPATYNQST